MPDIKNRWRKVFYIDTAPLEAVVVVVLFLLLIYIVPLVCMVLYRQLDMGQDPAPKILQTEIWQRKKQQGEGIEELAGVQENVLQLEMFCALKEAHCISLWEPVSEAEVTQLLWYLYNHVLC